MVRNRVTIAGAGDAPKSKHANINKDFKGTVRLLIIDDDSAVSPHHFGLIERSSLYIDNIVVVNRGQKISLGVVVNYEIQGAELLLFFGRVH